MTLSHNSSLSTTSSPLRKEARLLKTFLPLPKRNKVTGFCADLRLTFAKIQKLYGIIRLCVYFFGVVHLEQSYEYTNKITIKFMT